MLGLVALGGLVAFSVAALCVFYRSSQDALDEIVRVRTEALSAAHSGNREEAIRQLEHRDLLTRKLQVGVFIRTGSLDPKAAKSAEGLREALEGLRDALLAGARGADAHFRPIETAWAAVREAFRLAKPPATP